MPRLRFAYWIVANTVLLLFLVAVSAQVWSTVRGHAPRHSPYSELPEVVRKNYSHMTAPEVDDLLTATWSVPYQYAPWVGFREGARESRFVNVNDFGLRSNGRRRLDMSALENAVWFFGGSTTFGYGVRDDETIPAQLEAIIQSPVVNFGTAAYYSAQENVLLAQYLKSGYRPRSVLFLDGINEVCDLQAYQNEMTLLFGQTQRADDWGLGELAQPWIFALNKVGLLRRLTTGAVPQPPDADRLACDRLARWLPLRAILADNLSERESLCRRYGIACVTLVQPFAGVHGRHEDMSVTAENRRVMLAKFQHLEGSWRAVHSVFVTDALDQLMSHAYVDDVHYSAAASKLIAQAIAARVPDTLK